MSNVNLIEVMALVNLPASCLNRDEAQMPKECNFGGVDRAFASSASQKFVVRHSENFKSLSDKVQASIRTARIYEYIIPRLNNMPAEFESAVIALCDTLGKGGVTSKVAWDKLSDTYDFSKIDKKSSSAKGDSNQVIMIFSPSQVDFLVETIQRFVDEADGDIVKFAAFTNANVFERMEAARSKGENVSTITLDTALFGSMTASMFSASVPASMHVAPMFSTDALVRESDFYIASDDFVLANPEKAQGAANMGEIGYNCPCMYRYASLDLDILRENLKNVENRDETIKSIVPELIRTFVMTLPKGKQNTNAAYILPDMVCVNLKEKKIPCNYANAFAIPARANSNQSVTEKSIEKFVAEVNMIDKYYDVDVVERFYMNCRETGVTPNICTSVENIKDIVKGIQAHL